MDERQFNVFMARLAEMLQGVRQYIGARYVPNYLDEPWNDTTQYEALDVVDNGMGTSYIAKKPVPPGTPLSDREFWFVYGSTSGAIINLQNQIDAIVNTAIPGINSSIESLTNLTKFASDAPILNVKNYGAVGNGIADDTDAINDAIDALNESGGGILYFPKGNYIVNGALNSIDVTCTIFSDSLAKITATSLSSGETLITCNATEISIRGLFFVGGIDGYAVDTSGGINIEQCIFSGFDTQIHVLNDIRTKIIGNYMVSPTSYQILVEAPLQPDSGDNIIAFNCMNASSPNLANIRINEGGGLTITGNKLMNAIDGIYECNNSGNQTSIIIIYGNSIENYTNSGIHLASSSTSIPYSHIIISNNQIAGKHSVIAEDNSILINIVDNTFLSDGSGNYAILLGKAGTSYAPEKVIIHDNNFGNFSHGVLLLSEMLKDIDIAIDNSSNMVRAIYYANVSAINNTIHLKARIAKELTNDSGNELISGSILSLGNSGKYKVSFQTSNGGSYIEGIGHYKTSAGVTHSDIVADTTTFLIVESGGQLLMYRRPAQGTGLATYEYEGCAMSIGV